MDMYEISAIDAYINRAYRIIIILPLKRIKRGKGTKQ